MAGIPRLLRRLPHDVLRLRVRRTAPGKPPTGHIDLYADATGALAGVDDDGAALSIGGGGASIANGGGTLAFDGSGKLTGSAPTGQDISLLNADGAGIIAAGATGDTTIYGASDASVRAKGDDGVEIHGGPSGSAHVDIEADGDVTINATPGKDIKLVNLPSSDPSVTDAVWLDGGVLVKSGSTVPSGGGSMSSFTLAGDGGSSQTINDGNTLTVAGGTGLVSAAGATDTVTLDLDVNSLTADASPDGAADYVATWDASASAHKKVLLNNLPGGGGGTASVVYTSAYGSPPASPNNGDWWLPSDSPGLAYARVSGAWVARGPLFPLTAPDDSGFAWINQGGASTVTTKGGIFLSGPATAPHSLRIRKQATPATPWTKTFLVLPLLNPRATATAGHVGLVFRQSSDGKLHTFSWWPTTSATDPTFSSTKWTNATTFSAHYVSVSPRMDCPLFLQIGDDGTNRLVKFSADGQNFETLHSIGRTDFLTADEWGFYVSAPDTTYLIGLTVLSIA